ncbi:MAG: response regulator [Rhodocyclales bacterium]|nr:response regulator [Rhodocyclales bacterium]
MSLDADPALPTRTLLLVDDEPSILASLRRLLRNEGYCILTAENGLAGLEQMATHEVGVVVCDGLMQGLTGAEFLQEVKVRFPLAVRILLTGFTDPDVVHDAIKTCQLFRFLPKPWDDDELRQTLRAAFRLYESHHYVR